MKSFQELEEFREYIVHFKPEFTEPVETKHGREAEAFAKLNSENAASACDTVRRMVKRLEELSGSSAPEWLNLKGGSKLREEG